MELNVYFNKVDPNAIIYAPGTGSASGSGFASVSDIMAEANTALGNDQSVASSRWREPPAASAARPFEQGQALRAAAASVVLSPPSRIRATSSSVFPFIDPSPILNSQTVERSTQEASQR